MTKDSKSLLVIMIIISHLHQNGNDNNKS